MITEKCVIEYNESLCDPIEPMLRTSLLILFVIGMILDFVCIKYRWLAKWIFYLEILTNFVGSMIPTYATQDYSRISYAFLIMILFLSYYCLDGK